MIKSFSLKKDSFLSEILFFNKIELRQVTLLFGGNGVGKSTLINGILKKEIDAEVNGKTKMYSYINSKQNFRDFTKNDHLSYNDMYDPSLFASKFVAEELSEGQSILYSVKDLFRLCDELDNESDHLVLLDEIDSGLSVDNVDLVAKRIKQICRKHPNIQFIISFNDYEFCRFFEDVFDMYHGKWIAIPDYETYRQLINKNKELLKKRRKSKTISI